jgi:hypothetical protein
MMERCRGDTQWRQRAREQRVEEKHAGEKKRMDP